MVFDARNVSKILIVKLAAIGDVMFATPLVENIRANYPDAQIHWLADSWTKSVLKHVPGISKVFFYDRPWLARSKIKAYLQIPFLIRKLKAEKYDLAIIPHRSNLAFRLARMAGIDCKVGFSNRPDKNLDITVKYDQSKHEIERNLDLLRGIGFKVHSNKMAFYLDETAIDNVYDGLSDKSGSIICMAPGGGVNPGLNMPLKRWPKEKYLQLAEQLEKLGYQVVLIGAADDTLICDFISQSSNTQNFCGRTTIAQTAAIIKQCALFVGNDSGPLYIAAAIGVPTLGIYGPTDPRLLAPLGDDNYYLWNKIECSPCYHPNSTIQGEYEQCEHNQKCLKDLPVEQVFEKAKKLIHHEKDLVTEKTR